MIEKHLFLIARLDIYPKGVNKYLLKVENDFISKQVINFYHNLKKNWTDIRKKS